MSHEKDQITDLNEYAGNDAVWKKASCKSWLSV